MRKLALILCLAVPGLAIAEGGDLWRWTDDNGTIHYSNIEQRIPDGATVVDSRITLEVDKIPPRESADLAIADGQVVDARRSRRRYARARHSAPAFEALPDAPRVYTDERLRFGCFTAGVLHSGGFANSGDVSPTYSCYPYRFGPQAWLNAAQAELSMRANGINPKDMMQLYMEEGGR